MRSPLIPGSQAPKYLKDCTYALISHHNVWGIYRNPKQIQLAEGFPRVMFEYSDSLLLHSLERDSQRIILDIHSEYLIYTNPGDIISVSHSILSRLISKDEVFSYLEVIKRFVS